MNEEDKELQTAIKECTSHNGGENEFNKLRDWVINSCPNAVPENYLKKKGNFI